MFIGDIEDFLKSFEGKRVTLNGNLGIVEIGTYTEHLNNFKRAYLTFKVVCFRSEKLRRKVVYYNYELVSFVIKDVKSVFQYKNLSIIDSYDSFFDKESFFFVKLLE